MRIKVLIPNSGMDRKTLNARETMLSRAVSTETEISVDCIQSGPVSIESVTDEVFAGPLLLQEAIRAEREGYDAFVVYCFSDLAITALRENVDIPVIGPGECAPRQTYYQISSALSRPWRVMFRGHTED